MMRVRPSFYNKILIRVPNAFELYQSGGYPGFKNDFSKKIFYRHEKTQSKSSFQHKTKFLLGHPEAL